MLHPARSKLGQVQKLGWKSKYQAWERLDIVEFEHRADSKIARTTQPTNLASPPHCTTTMYVRLDPIKSYATSLLSIYFQALCLCALILGWKMMKEISKNIAE